jgi:hypothetical protein
MQEQFVPNQKSANDAPQTSSELIESIELHESKLTDPARCNRLSNLVNSYLSKKCSNKKNNLGSCTGSDETGCACGSSSGSATGAKVDLIVLIDTSGSMGGAASTVSSAASAAIEQAQATCETDLQVTYLGVDGTWAGTLFSTSHRAYLLSLGVAATLSTDNPTGGYDSEEGANAIEDLSKYARWREGACRAIFYISDEELDGSSPRGDIANEAAATNATIASANLNNVTVFAHHLTYQHPPLGASVIANYNNLCTSTGGQAFFSAAATQEGYVDLLSRVICTACGNKCKEVEFPVIKPCVSISWGDSDCDCLETDDVETLCITICNCYSNLTFSSLSVGAIYVTDSSGNPVPILPDGTPSVQILPLGPICFGDVPPCKDGKPGCISREFVILTRGAKGGHYKVVVNGICYSITNHYDASECFDLNLCQD